MKKQQIIIPNRRKTQPTIGGNYFHVDLDGIEQIKAIKRKNGTAEEVYMHGTCVCYNSVDPKNLFKTLPKALIRLDELVQKEIVECRKEMENLIGYQAMVKEAFRSCKAEK